MASKFAGKIRPSQLITTFGPGSIVNFSDDSVMIMGIDDWNAGVDIYEPRLQKKWDLHSFKVPGSKGGIPSVSFPRYRVCPKCKSLRENYERNGKGTYNCHCEKSGARGAETHAARLIAACDNGHIMEFPWVDWAHRNKGRCHNPELTLQSRGASASALSDLLVQCKTCGAKESMSGALSKQGLKGVQDKCSGDRPWLGDRVSCDKTPRGMQKGATNVYFSVVGSSLSIPKYANPVQDELHAYWPTLSGLAEKGNMTLVRLNLEAIFGDKTEEEITELMDAVHARVQAPTEEEDFLYEEWNTFLSPTEQKERDFETRHVEVDSRLKPIIDQVVLVPRLREVRAIRGFRRINLEGPISPITQDVNKKWMPGVEIRGEGIFIKFDKKSLIEWEKKELVKGRSEKLFKAAGETEFERLPRTILIHTFAHLLIRELSLVAGYSASSIRERLYVSPKMYGLLLYTGSSDSDGSLGGLIHHGSKERFYELVSNALESARFCSSDPLCSDNLGGTFGKLNGAACYACSIVSETSCERKNQLLDRGLVVNLPGQPQTGFWE